MKDTRINEVSRAGLYTRVSKEEMAKFGLSLDAQLERLQEYAKENNLNYIEFWNIEELKEWLNK